MGAQGTCLCVSTNMAAPPHISDLFSVMVKNVSCSADSFFDLKHKLEDEFGKFGKVGDVHLPKDRNFGFVRFYSQSDAEEACKEMDGKSFDGGYIKCQMASRPKTTSDELQKRRSRSPRRSSSRLSPKRQRYRSRSFS